MSHDQLTISMILVHFLSLEKAVWFFCICEAQNDN